MNEPDESIHLDWAEFLEGTTGNLGHEFDLSQLRPGDILRVTTGHTRYLFRMITEREAELTTERQDRPSGLVRIMGCTFGLSSTIRPDHLFCGGSLEFTFTQGADRMTHTTTTIRKIDWMRKADTGSKSHRRKS